MIMKRLYISHGVRGGLKAVVCCSGSDRILLIGHTARLVLQILHWIMEIRFQIDDDL